VHMKRALGLGLRGPVTAYVTGNGWKLQSQNDWSHEMEKKADT